MKTIIKKHASLAILGVALALAGGTARAQVTTNLFTFDTSATGAWASWAGEWFGSWDGAQDHTANGGGSLYWYQDISYASGVQVFNTWGGNPYYAGNPAQYVDLSTATNISFWVKWDTSYSTLGIDDFNTQNYASTPGWGDHGITIGIQVVTPSGQGTNVGTAYIPNSASNGWALVNIPITAGSVPNENQAVGLSLFKWSNTDSSQTGIFAFWIDDIQAEYPGVLPPEILKNPVPSVQGFNIYDDGNAGDRQNIATVVTNVGPAFNYSWVGSANPVTYSVDISQAPPASYSNYQVQIMVFPGTNVTGSSPDWNETNALVLFIQRATNGVIGQLRYKLNNANNNSYLWGSDTNVFGPNPGQPLTNKIVAGYGGLLCSVTNVSGFIGTWSVTIANGGNITLTSPNVTATGAFPSGDDAAFASPVTVFWGTQPNMPGYYQDVVLDNVSITGSASTLNANLTQPLDPAKMVVRASNSGLLFSTPTNAVYWLQWAPPNVSFALQSASSVVGPWANVAGPSFTTTNFANSFDSAASFTNIANYNPPPTGVRYDSGDDASPMIAWAAGPSYDAGGGASSGSVKLGWVLAGGSGGEAITMDIFPNGQNCSGGTLSFDIMIDPSSLAGTNSDYGYFAVVTRDGSYAWNPTSFGGSLLAAAGGATGQWAHVSIPLGTGAGSTVRALTFQNSNDGNITGAQAIYIDNVQITTSSGSSPVLHNINGQSSTFITSPMLPSSSAGYFRLAK